MRILPTRRTPFKEERPATELLHDSAEVRVVSFHLLAGQEVAPHRSDSTVLVQVIDGEGYFGGADSEVRLAAGDAAVFTPGEIHAIRAPEGPLRFTAILSPRPA